MRVSARVHERNWLALALNSQDYTPTQSQLCSFVTTLPASMAGFFSEHRTRATAELSFAAPYRGK